MTRTDPRPARSPFIGIIMLDTAFPRLVGDVGNPRTFSFPVRYATVSGASPQRVVKQADPGLLQPFCDAARKLEALGAAALATSCGFLALFQQELAACVSIPVFSSSLLQIHLARAIIQEDQEVGIVTADSRNLTRAHFFALGLTQVPGAVIGLQTAHEFSAVFLGNKDTLDPFLLEQEVIAASHELMKRYPRVGALVLECTNLPPFAQVIQQNSGLPVFDVVTMINYAYSIIKNI